MSVMSRDCLHVLIGDASDHAVVSLSLISFSSNRRLGRSSRNTCGEVRLAEDFGRISSRRWM